MSPRFFTPALLLRKSDAELTALVTQGHEAAFDAIVLRHRAHLTRQCWRMLRDQRAEDAVQQAFEHALAALRSGTEVRDLRAWLSRIARNVALDELTARSSDQAQLNEDLEDLRRSGEYERRASLRETLRAVAALPERQRTALVRSAAGESPAAIAQELGVTSVAARQLLHRARVNVRAAVRVVSPPPLVWLSRRLAAAWERVPRVAGAGAAPVVSKIAATVVASATIAAPVTVIHSVLSHHPHPAHRHQRASRPAQAADSVALPTTIASRAPAPAPAPAVSAPQAQPAPTPSAPAHASTSGNDGRAVSATATGAPVSSGAGSGAVANGGPVATDASAGGPVATDASASGPTASPSSAAGPVSSASASAPTEPAAASANSAQVQSSSADTSSAAPSSGDASGPSTAP